MLTCCIKGFDVHWCTHRLPYYREWRQAAAQTPTDSHATFIGASSAGLRLLLAQ